MNHHLFADIFSSIGSVGTLAIVVVVLLFGFFVFAAIFAGRYTKVGPNQVLILSGRKHKFVEADGNVQTRGFRVVKGGGTFVLPVLEKVDVLSLELLTIDVQTPEVY